MPQSSHQYVGGWTEQQLEHALKMLRKYNETMAILPVGTVVPVDDKATTGKRIGQLRKTGTGWIFDKAV